MRDRLKLYYDIRDRVDELAKHLDGVLQRGQYTDEEISHARDMIDRGGEIATQLDADDSEPSALTVITGGAA